MDTDSNVAKKVAGSEGAAHFVSRVGTNIQRTFRDLFLSTEQAYGNFYSLPLDGRACTQVINISAPRTAPTWPQQIIKVKKAVNMLD